ncbi:MAG: hypothetical protein JWQ25_2976 [Daejeonella sp.]|nr:hypothetical protein [Daejeonella sp.]
MKATYLDYSETNCFSSTLIRYIEKDPQISSFISYPPTFEGFEAQLSDYKPIADRLTLVNVLKEQYSKLSAGSSFDQTDFEAVNENVQSLALENTYTVTTGHQLNIFTGPLYFVFKIVTAIKLASDLKAKFPDKNFVPIYWMATEDHDFDEINHTYISGKKVVWDHPAKGATGRLKLDNILSSIREFTGVLGGSDKALALTKVIEDAYTKPGTLADATRLLVNALFQKYGLVIIDADHIDLKTQFIPIIKDDIIHQHSFKNISDTDSKLKAIGVNTQVNPREINFFYLLDNFRERIVFEDGEYRVLNSEISFTEVELIKEIENNPERFSPNVVMRPLYQEIILPNIAYIGGGAEIVYWLQLKQNFDFYKVNFPILIPRNSALIVDETLDRKLNRLDLKFLDLFKNTEELQKEWILRHSEHTLNLKKEWIELESIFTELQIRAKKIDPTLGPSTEAVKTRLEKALKSLEKKLIKAEKKNHEEAISSISNIRKKLFPKGGLQERTESFALFYVKSGACFMNDLFNHFEPLNFKFSILQEGCDNTI